jgi:hypothetical protein
MAPARLVHTIHHHPTEGKIMRELKKEELKAVSGGTFFLLGGLLRHLFAAKSYSYCPPSQPVKPQPPKC